MHLNIICLAYIIFAIANVRGSNYYGACNDDSFASSCSLGAKLIPITDAHKKLVIDAHNTHRNLIAGGGVRKLKPACHMPPLKWNDKLAKLAEYNVRQCKAQHDACRQNSGQNIFWRTGVVPSLQKAVHEWYKEVKHVTQSQIDVLSTVFSKHEIRHFTVMVADYNTDVGCAASTFKENGLKKTLVTCNYGKSNIEGHAVYKSCAKAASECKSGKHSRYHNLCSV